MDAVQAFTEINSEKLCGNSSCQQNVIH